MTYIVGGNINASHRRTIMFWGSWYFTYFFFCHSHLFTKLLATMPSFPALDFLQRSLQLLDTLQPPRERDRSCHLSGTNMKSLINVSNVLCSTANCVVLTLCFFWVLAVVTFIDVENLLTNFFPYFVPYIIRILQVLCNTCNLVFGGDNL